MGEPRRSSSAPLQSAPRWPSPTPRTPSPPRKSTTPSPGSHSSGTKSPSKVMQDLLNEAKKASGRNTQPPQKPPPQQPTLLDLLNQANITTQLKEKLVTNPKNGHHYKIRDVIGSSDDASAVCMGMYCVNDADELATMQHYDISVAVKVTNTGDQEVYAKLVDQVNRTRHLDHPNLLQVKEEMVVEDKFWVVFPFMDGSLRCLLKSVFSNGVPEDLIAIVLKEVLEALANLHQQGHLHQELNAAHIYYNLSMPAIKIGHQATIYEHNSGVAGQEFLGVAEQTLPPGSLPVRGICEWAAAPEIYHLEEEYTDKSDVWLVGITALELVFGRIQVKDRRGLELLIAEVISKDGYRGKGKGKAKAVGKYLKKMINKMKIGKSGSSSSSKGNVVTLSRAFKGMLALCFTENAGERATAAALLQHDFFRICDGVFDVYDFRNAVQLALREREMSVETSSGSTAVGTASGSTAAGTATGSNAAGTATGGNAAGTATGGNAAGASTGGNVGEGAKP